MSDNGNESKDQDPTGGQINKYRTFEEAKEFLIKNIDRITISDESAAALTHILGVHAASNHIKCIEVQERTWKKLLFPTPKTPFEVRDIRSTTLNLAEFLSTKDWKNTGVGLEVQCYEDYLDFLLPARKIRRRKEELQDMYSKIFSKYPMPSGEVAEKVTEIWKEYKQLLKKEEMIHEK